MKNNSGFVSVNFNLIFSWYQVLLSSLISLLSYCTYLILSLYASLIWAFHCIFFSFAFFIFDNKAESVLTFCYYCIYITCLTTLTLWCQRFNFMICREISIFCSCGLGLMLMVTFLLTPSLLWDGSVAFPKTDFAFCTFFEMVDKYFQLMISILDDVLCTSCLIPVFDHKKKVYPPAPINPELRENYSS